MPAKSDLRRCVLAARRALDPGVRAEADSAIVTFAADLAGSAGAPTGATESACAPIGATESACAPIGATVAAYAPVGGREPGGAALPDALAATGVRVLLPVLRDDNDLDWAAHEGLLAPTGRGLSEPVGPRLGLAAIAEATLIFVPAVAVDLAGVRLGRGGGSYDRALARAGGLVVALLYPGELVDALPAEPHDRPVHAVYDGAHLHWTEAGRMTHHWHSYHRSASDGG